jgi:hypothetical protein
MEMLKAPWRSRWRRCVWRCFLTFSRRSRVRLIESPIMRRSSSICFSPGPPRTPAPPVWRSRCDQRRTSRVLTYCRRASSTCSLPSWLRARWAKISRISRVRSLTGRPRWRSRLRCWPGLSDWSNSTSVAPCASARALISSALPLPTNSAASGALRLAGDAGDRLQAGGAGELAQLGELGVEVGQPRSTPTRMVGRPERSWVSGKNGVRGNSGWKRPARGREPRSRQLAASPPSAVEKFTARPGTMVEMACL